ncbi:MAG: RNA polymerase sigma factor [Eubacteriales bacterium]
MLLFLTIIQDASSKSKLEEIYNLYRKELYYTAYNILKDPYESEDVVQSAMLKVSNYLEKINEIKCNKTKGLMVIIVRGIAINIYNKRKGRATIPLENIEEALTDETFMTPEQHILRMDQGERIAKEMSRLNPEYADVLSLKYTYDLTNGEIAKILDTTEGNVRVKLYRARRALHTLLGGDTYGQQ